jgi:hypothetical protein
MPRQLCSSKVAPGLPGAPRFYELAQILAVTLTCLAPSTSRQNQLIIVYDKHKKH